MPLIHHFDPSWSIAFALVVDIYVVETLALNTGVLGVIVGETAVVLEIVGAVAEKYKPLEDAQV